jgi:integrase
MIFARHAGLRNSAGEYPCPSTAELVGFASLRAMKGDSVSTVRRHLRGVGQWFLRSCDVDPRLGRDGLLKHTLAACLRGIGKMVPTKRRFKEALTVDKLRLCLSGIGDLGLNDVDMAMYRAALLVAVFGLLRIGELTSPTQRTFNPKEDMRRKDIEFMRGIGSAPIGMRYHIKAAKTDTKREGQTVHIMSTGVVDLCPVRALRRYMKLTKHRQTKDALFRDSQGRLLTRGSFVKVLRRLLGIVGFDPKMYSSHSCRRGGCQSLAEAGLPEHAIKAHGRWKSDAYLVYLKLTDRAHRRAARSMARVGFLSEETRRNAMNRLRERKAW